MNRPLAIAGFLAALFTTFCVLAFGAVWALQWALSTEKLTALIERSASTFLERQLTIDRLERPKFPVTELVAHGVRLKEKNGAVIVDCPEVRATASFLSLFRLRLGVEEIRFENAALHVRYGKNGRTNIERIVDDIQARPDDPVRRSIGALAFHRFVIQNASVTVTNAAGEALLPAPALANGEVAIKISPTGIWAPYAFDIDGGDGRVRLRATGRFSANPTADINLERLPASLLAPRIKALAACEGTTDGRFAWNGGAEMAVAFALSPMRLCGNEAGRLPDRLSGTVGRSGERWSFALVASGEHTDVNLAAATVGAEAPTRWTLTAPRLDIPEVAGWIGRAREISGSTTPVSNTESTRELSFSARISTLTVGPLIFEQASAEVRRSTDGVTRFAPVTATLYGGGFTGEGSLNDGNVTLTAGVDDVNLAQAARTFHSTSPLTGLLAARLRGHGPATNLLHGFGGDISVRLTDGRIPEVPTVLKALTSANLVKLTNQMRGDSQEGIQITQGDASATIDGGTANVNHLLLDSRVLRIGFTGKIAFLEGKLDGVIVLQPLNLADQIINEIPVLRTLLLGKDKTFLPLWFAVKGDWKDPRVRSMPTKSLAAPVKNVLDALLKFPQRAFDALRGKK